MGYTTDFSGSLKANKPIPEDVKAYINLFSERRHMKRDADGCRALFAAGLGRSWKGDVGIDGAYYLSCDDDNYGQTKDDTIIDYNNPGGNCPGLWCQWIINGNELCWDGGEKFYYYNEWLEYLMENFFTPEGILWNGKIHWQGEAPDDYGDVEVIDNEIYINGQRFTTVSTDLMVDKDPLSRFRFKNTSEAGSAAKAPSSAINWTPDKKS